MIQAIRMPLCRVSIHSPRRSEGRRYSTFLDGVDITLFQSTPPAEARGDVSSWRCGLDHVKVSIHSPRRSEGRLNGGSAVRGRADGFQSTPPAEARGDVCAGGALPGARLEFQSTPPAEARGDPGIRRGRDVGGAQVSIHSPRRSEGRRRRRCNGLASGQIQASFNPLPPPKRGETFSIVERGAPVVVSIHSPRRSEGRPGPEGGSRRYRRVSIHSPRRSEGRLHVRG